MNENSHVVCECGSGVVALSFLIGVGRKIAHTSKRGESLDLWGCCSCDVSSCLDNAGFQGAVERQQQLRSSLYRPWDPLVCNHIDCWDFYGSEENQCFSLCPPPSVPSPLFFPSLYAPHMRSVLNAEQGIPNSIFLPARCALPPPAILLCVCFVLPTSRPVYEFVWFVVVVCSCHRVLCCCCCCCYCFLAARFLAECLSSKYGLHQLCWK